ncbi:MAG TPA: Bax inhibitor-1/YccA family protein [Flavipsychrobacter sp.]
MEDRNTPINFTDYTVVDSAKGTRTMAKTFMANVFLWMFAALGISAFCAYLFASTPTLMLSLINETTGGLNPLGWVVMFAPLGFVLTMSFAFNRLSAAAMVGFFIAYAAVTGVSLSFILLIYTTGSVISCFAAASLMFGIMAVMGYTTDKDLTSFGRILTMGLIGIVIASLINMFIGSDRMGYIISIVGVAVFTGLTAYDVQKLKRIGEGIEYEGASAADTKKLSIMGALTLYLDFINLFLMLLRLFGGRRD